MPDLRIRRIEPEEASTTAELIARVFPRDPSTVRLMTWYRWMLSHPQHRWDYVRVVELDGRIVSHLLLVERHIQLRYGTVRSAGLSVVATLQEFQGRGLNRRLINETLTYAGEQGFAISLLDGIPDYYARYGYAVVMPKAEMRLKTVEALRAEKKLAVVELEASKAEGRTPQLQELYESETKGLVGAAKRDRAYWSWLLERGGKLLLAIRGDVPEGYVWLGEDGFVVEEAVSAEPQAVESLVAAVAERAKEGITPELVFRVYPDQPFARFLALTIGGRLKVDYPRNAGWMGRILDIGKVLEASLPSRWPKKVKWCFVTEFDQAQVQLGPGGTEVSLDRCDEDADPVEIRQSQLLQLLFGYATAAELTALGLLRAADETVSNLEAFFPKASPGLFPRDHF